MKLNLVDYYENGMAGIMSQIDLVVDSDVKKSLMEFDSLNKDLAAKSLNNIYKRNIEVVDTNKGDERMQILQETIKELESKLSKADEEDKASIQAQIAVVYAQMMSLLSVL